ncbi:uncharacterized protein EDB91DRAFT_1337762 [Suillus paluster]|uniref:uncharacterized protein n=1 Tax=Suillus paluster TaxID=48578 RepID=UPI001B87BDF2
MFLFAILHAPPVISRRGEAVLNSNAEVSLWAAANNHLKGEWTNIQDVTGLAWSKQPDYGIAPTPILDSSMLALGNRAGSIMFLRFNRNSDSGGSVSYIHTEPLSDHWITHLSWSPWVIHGVGQCKDSRTYRMKRIEVHDGALRIKDILSQNQRTSGLFVTFSTSL